MYPPASMRNRPTSWAFFKMKSPELEAQVTDVRFTSIFLQSITVIGLKDLLFKIEQ